jgi:uncharacterized membrane protein
MFCTRCGNQIDAFPCAACGHAGLAEASRAGSNTGVASRGGWDAAKARQIAFLVYGLLAAGVILFPLYLIGGILSFVALGSSSDIMLQSHYRWQIRTFIFGLVWGLVTVVLIITSIGIIIAIPLAIVAVIWIISRVVRGFTRLQGDTAMYPPLPKSTETTA